MTMDKIHSQIIEELAGFIQNPDASRLERALLIALFELDRRKVMGLPHEDIESLSQHILSAKVAAAN